MCNTEDEASLLSSSQHYIAHAAGAVDGRTYLNCKEGLLSSLENGYTYIELDLGLTADSNLVCVHDWPSFNKKTGGDSLKSDAPIANAEFLKKNPWQIYPFNIRGGTFDKRESPVCYCH